MKKAMELSMLCGNDVFLIIRDNCNDQTVMYNSISCEDESLINDVYVNKNYNFICSNNDVKTYITNSTQSYLTEIR